MFPVVSMTVPVKVVTLGAGSEVGRSCFIIGIDDANILVDTGVHLEPKSPEDRVPNIPKHLQIDAVFVTHYHLDHIGALPYLRQVQRSINADCEVYMTSPTRILSPALLTDFCRGPGRDLFCSNHVNQCFMDEKIRVIGCNEVVNLESRRGFSVTAAYAGHVIGGVLLVIKYKGVCVVYTGDFSVLPDSLLKPIQIPPFVIPTRGVDVVITETTHATTVTPVSSSINDIEKNICSRIKRALSRGGRVLVPMFAVGRTQEFATMIRRHLGQNIPLYTSSPGGHKACVLTTSVLRQWTRDSENTESLDVRFLADSDVVPDKCVIFASPAMIEGGSSLKLFLDMCGDDRNLVILTGYCNKGTVGNSVILFASRKVDRRQISVHGRAVQVRCECFYSPFSGHTDSVGIIRVLKELRPRVATVLVHGQRDKMERFRSTLLNDGLVGNGVSVDIPVNYQSLEYRIAAFQEGIKWKSKKVNVSKRFARPSGFSLTEARDSMSDGLPECSFDIVENVMIACDQNISVSIRLEKEYVVFQWESEYGRGPEWLTRQPLVDSFMYVISQMKSSTDIPDQFSISDCSD
jgi:integrator complex subunit 11